MTDGHCAFWADIVLRAALKDDRISDVHLVCSAALAARLKGLMSMPGLSHKELSRSDLQTLLQPSLAKRGLAQWSKARSLVNAAENGVCLIPFFDHALMGAVLDRRPVSGRISGIIFRPPNTFQLPSTLSSRISAMRRNLMYICSKRPSVRRLFTLDERAASETLSGRLGRLKYVPDPAPSISLSRTKKAKNNPERTQFLLFGALAIRKGVVVLLNALCQLPEAIQAKIDIQIIGRIVPEDRTAILQAFETAQVGAAAAHIELEDRFLSDTELEQAVIDADVLLAPYQGHVGSSGVLHWASAAGKPVLTQNSGLTGYQCHKYNLGLAVDCTQTGSLAEAIEVLVSPEQRHQLGSKASKAWGKDHTHSRFSSTLLNGLME